MKTDNKAPVAVKSFPISGSHFILTVSGAFLYWGKNE